MDHAGGSVPRVQFEVQKITGISVGSGNVRTYQVQWAPAWVSGLHLVGCEHLIEEFLQNQQGKDSVESDLSMTVECQPRQVEEIDYYQEHNDQLVTSSFPAKNSYENESATNSSLDDNGMACDTYNETDSHCNSSAKYEDSRSAVSSMISVPIKIEDSSNEEGAGEERCVIPAEHGDFECTDNKDQVSSLRSDDGCSRVLEPRHPASMAEISSTKMNIIELDYDSTKERRDRKSTDGGGEKHECEECGKTFKFRCLLLRHIPVHIGQLRYQCNYCHKSYARKDSHMKHVAIHTRESLTQCVDYEQLPDSDASL